MIYGFSIRCRVQLESLSMRPCSEKLERDGELLTGIGSPYHALHRSHCSEPQTWPCPEPPSKPDSIREGLGPLALRNRPTCPKWPSFDGSEPVQACKIRTPRHWIPVPSGCLYLPHTKALIMILGRSFASDPSPKGPILRVPSLHRVPLKPGRTAQIHFETHVSTAERHIQPPEMSRPRMTASTSSA